MILKRPLFERAYRRLTSDQRFAVGAAIAKLEQSFGRPHEHAGIGVRSIGSFFECRAGLQLRVLFLARDGDLVLVTVGNDDAIRTFVKENS